MQASSTGHRHRRMLTAGTHTDDTAAAASVLRGAVSVDPAAGTTTSTPDTAAGARQLQQLLQVLTPECSAGSIVRPVAIVPINSDCAG